MDEDAETPKAAKKDPTLALFLGLYLILLAFFVLLNTLASLKENGSKRSSAACCRRSRPRS
jgi:hypothetical protein